VEAHVGQRGERRDGGDPQVIRVLDPEDGAVQQQVADGAAPDGGDDGDDQHAEEVELLAAGRERAADREDRHARQAEELHGVHGDNVA
jgi:hypothetical protein